jgi:hypothetical protein
LIHGGAFGYLSSIEEPYMRSAWLVAAALVIPSAVLLSQQNSTAPQPRANALPAIGPAQPKFGRPVPRPDGMLPKLPDGFTVSAYAFVPMANGRPGPMQDFVSHMLVSNGENGSAIDAWAAR